MRKVNNLVAFIIDVRLIIITILDWLLWTDKFTDVDCASICELFQMISQILQVITQVMSLRNIFLERILFIFNLLFFSLLLHPLHRLSCISLSVVLDCL